MIDITIELVAKVDASVQDRPGLASRASSTNEMKKGGGLMRGLAAFHLLP